MTAEQIYLDYNASTPIASSVAASMRPYLARHFGNPSSAHWASKPASEALFRARAQVARLISADAGEIYFTSGGTESNNWAVKGVALRRALESQTEPPHVVISAVEHPSVSEPCRFLELAGVRCTKVPVDRHGLVNPDDVRKAIEPRTILVSVMHANNEVGTIQPVAEIAQIAREHGVLCHTDAAQSLGKVDVSVDSLGVDLLTFAGHKLYAPKGIGALYVRRGTSLDVMMHGAGHERGLRSGTENVLLAVGLGAACQLAIDEPCEDHLRSVRDHFHGGLKRELGDRVVLNGHPERRLPNTLNLGFTNVIGAELLEKLEGVAATTGAACHSGQRSLSPVLREMQVPPEIGHGAIRFSVGRATTFDDVDRVVAMIREAL